MGINGKRRHRRQLLNCYRKRLGEDFFFPVIKIFFSSLFGSLCHKLKIIHKHRHTSRKLFLKQTFPANIQTVLRGPLRKLCGWNVRGYTQFITCCQETVIPRVSHKTPARIVKRMSSVKTVSTLQLRWAMVMARLSRLFGASTHTPTTSVRSIFYTIMFKINTFLSQ